MSTPARLGVPSPLSGYTLVPGNPGNSGGKKGRSGPKKDRVRHALLEMGHEKALPFLSGLLDGKVNVQLVGLCRACGMEQPAVPDDWMEGVLAKVDASVSDRLKASEQAWRYGLGVQKEVSVDNVRERVRRTLAIIAETCPLDQAQALITAIEPVWK